MDLVTVEPVAVEPAGSGTSDCGTVAVEPVTVEPVTVEPAGSGTSDSRTSGSGTTLAELG